VLLQPELELIEGDAVHPRGSGVFLHPVPGGHERLPGVDSGE
jgi:hypothetical protein